MDNVNETVLKHCRFLNDGYFDSLYEAFIEAFSDYVVPFALTVPQFKNHIRLNGVDLNRTVGCLRDGRLVGFSLNGFGDWDGQPTVYDAGTGVVPSHRRKGMSDAMFEFMLPRFRADGIKRFLLEVVTTNTAAIGLYEKLGFVTGRTLALLQCDTAITSSPGLPAGIEVREIVEPDWELFTTFWDGQPSWQNSIAALIRNWGMKRMLGAWKGDRCVGYIVFSGTFGRVSQMGVDKKFRGQGVGTALAKSMQSTIDEGFSLQVINIDSSLVGAIEFFKKLGFYERLSQYEMTLSL